MDIEHELKVIPFDLTNPDDFEAAVAKMKADGWNVFPGSKPMAIFPVYRVKPEKVADCVGQIRMTIDDSKVGIIRGGKVIS